MYLWLHWSVVIGALTEEQMRSPYANASWDAWDLRRAINDGWRPAHEHASWD
jgi:hypothetical protein